MTVTSLRAQENVEDSRWETAVRCIKKYEGWHGPEHYPYVAYVACLAYQVGPYRLLGYGRMPKSTLIRKLEAGNRGIYADFIRYCHYKGKKIPSIERRRKEEYRLLFMP